MGEDIMFEDFGIMIGAYNATLPTLTDGQRIELQTDVNGRLLVQADVSVLIDFLGLNGASDNANILIVGTEDGTSGGTAHAIRLASDGAVAIQDNGGSITVDAVNLDIRDLTHVSDSVSIGDGTDFLAINADGSINITDNGGSLTVDAVNLDIRDLVAATDSVASWLKDGSGNSITSTTGFLDVFVQNTVTVSATDLDIRNLSHTQDSVKIGDGTDFLAINADGSINVAASLSAAGTNAYAVTDALAANADGLITGIDTAQYYTVASVAIGAGVTGYIHGWSWCADGNATARLVAVDGANTYTYKMSLNSTAMPTVSEHFSDPGHIEIAGAAGKTVEIQIIKRGAGADIKGAGSIHIRYQ